MVEVTLEHRRRRGVTLLRRDRVLGQRRRQLTLFLLKAQTSVLRSETKNQYR
jgi:hypothetical protein